MPKTTAAAARPARCGGLEGTIVAICASIKSEMPATVITPQPVSRSLAVWSNCGFFGVGQSDCATFSDL